MAKPVKMGRSILLYCCGLELYWVYVPGFFVYQNRTLASTVPVKTILQKILKISRQPDRIPEKMAVEWKTRA